ncbi:MAG: hypothetical protein ABW174_12135 [Flavitalea sp.]
MQTNRFTTKLAIAVAACFTLVAWKHEPTYRTRDTVYYLDTIPGANRQSANKTSRDFDKELEELDRGLDKLNEKSKEYWDKVDRDLKQQLSKIDFERISLDAEKALKNIDLKKLNEGVQTALASVDFDKIGIELEKSLQHLDVKVDVKSEEIREALAEAKAEVKRSIAEAKKMTDEDLKRAARESEADIRKAKETSEKEVRKAMREANKAMEELKLEKFSMAETMEKAKQGVTQYRNDLKGYQEMVYDMEKDGLLSTKENYRIMYDGEKLLINGKEQDTTITEKYKKYLRGQTVIISKKEGKLKVNRSDDKED